MNKMNREQGAGGFIQVRCMCKNTNNLPSLAIQTWNQTRHEAFSKAELICFQFEEIQSVEYDR